MATDASYRFERGVDPDGTINALNRAVQLIRNSPGALLLMMSIDCYPGKTQTGYHYIKCCQNMQSSWR